MTTILNEGDSAGTTGAAQGSPVDAAPDPDKGTSRGRLVLRRFVRNKAALVCLALIVVLYFLAFCYPLFTQWTYDQQDYTSFLVPPGGTHWFGTDKIGTDMFAQVMRGLQKSLTIGLLVGIISTSFAALVGTTAGYFLGWTDRSLMWIVDLLLTLPSFLIIAICSPAFRGKTWLIFVGLLAVFQWMITARIVRGMTLTLKEREFVKAAKFMGQPARRIIFKHILPNMASLLIIDATINVGSAVLAETSLSFFGFGVQPPDVSLGTLISDGTESTLTYPWLFFIPAGFLVLFVLSVNFAGDGLRDALDPSSTKGRRKESKRKALGELRKAKFDVQTERRGMPAPQGEGKHR
ncbi:ABC transporter permease [Solihabitans fulvus]|uniref:ABC transporter permease n=1 Tax=Solihabitans fulvus TaxID=1892852 RepID=UPI001CB76878|nr:ABC transporter permease [Solihabitans fulvus]